MKTKLIMVIVLVAAALNAVTSQYLITLTLLMLIHAVGLLGYSSGPGTRNRKALSNLRMPDNKYQKV